MHKRHYKRALHRHRCGATSVEMAVVLPVVLLFFFAAFEFARVAMIRPTVDTAVYDAARRGILPGGTSTEAQQVARRILATVGVKDASVKVRPQRIVAETPEITVAIDVPLDSNTFLPAQFFRGKRVQRSLTIQREGV